MPPTDGANVSKQFPEPLESSQKQSPSWPRSAPPSRRSSLLSTSCIFESAEAEKREGGGGGREAGKQARSLGHLIQLLAILLWDHYTALLLSQSACLLLPAAYPSIQGVFFVWNKAGNLSYHLRV